MCSVKKITWKVHTGLYIKRDRFDIRLDTNCRYYVLLLKIQNDVFKWIDIILWLGADCWTWSELHANSQYIICKLGS